MKYSAIWDRILMRIDRMYDKMYIAVYVTIDFMLRVAYIILCCVAWLDTRIAQ